MSTIRISTSPSSTSRYGEIKRNRDVYAGGIDRYDAFCERMVEDGSKDRIPERYYSPSEDISIIINERVEIIPTNFSIVGSNKDNLVMLQKDLWEKSRIESKLPESYKEMDIAGDSFWEIKPVVDVNAKHMFQFEINQLLAENVNPVVDPTTRELKCIIINETRSGVDPDGFGYTYEVKKKIYPDKIEYEEENTNAGFFKKIVGLNKSRRTIENPFFGTGFIGVLWFKGQERSDSYTSKYPIKELIEPQLQIDKAWTSHEMAINSSIFPIAEFRKANRSNYDGIYMGAGATIASFGEQELHLHKPEVDIEGMLKHIAAKTRLIYDKGGVLPPEIKKEIFGTDSIGIGKFASKRTIELAKMKLRAHKDEIGKMFKAFLEMNGKKYEGETIKIMDDIIQVDLEKVASTYGVLMNYGIVDDEFVWNEVFPDIDEMMRERIRKQWKERYGADPTLNSKNLNIDNNLKGGSAAKIAGNKQQNKEKGSENAKKDS